MVIPFPDGRLLSETLGVVSKVIRVCFLACLILNWNLMNGLQNTMWSNMARLVNVLPWSQLIVRHVFDWMLVVLCCYWKFHNNLHKFAIKDSTLIVIVIAIVLFFWFSDLRMQGEWGEEFWIESHQRKNQQLLNCDGMFLSHDACCWHCSTPYVHIIRGQKA